MKLLKKKAVCGDKDLDKVLILIEELICQMRDEKMSIAFRPPEIIAMHFNNFLPKHFDEFFLDKINKCRTQVSAVLKFQVYELENLKTEFIVEF